MESSGGGTCPTFAHKWKRITWTISLTNSLLEIANDCDHTSRGFVKRLEERWAMFHQTLPSKGTALVQKLRRIKSKDPESLLNPQEVPDHADVVDPPTHQPTAGTAPSQEDIHRQVLTTLNKLLLCRKEPYLSRKPIVIRWWKVDLALMALVDGVLQRIWETEGDGTLWFLNCLIYAGAGVVREIAQDHQPPDHTASRLTADREDTAIERVTGDSECEVTVTSADHIETTNSRRGSNSQITKTMRTVRQALGWINSEIDWLKSGRKKLTRRRIILRKKLETMFGKGRFDNKRLQALRAKQESILRIKTVQAQRSKRARKYNMTNDSFRENGPRGPNRVTKQNVPAAEVKGIEDFWKAVWGVEGNYNLKHPSIREWKESLSDDLEHHKDEPPMDRESAWRLALKKINNWTAPGPDGIPGFWLKYFQITMEAYKECVGNMMDEQMEIPSWLVRGRTVLIPKEGGTGDPSHYRPITCLNTMYKTLTGVIAQILTQYVSVRNILPEEQKALKRGKRGCLDALVIDAAVVNEVRVRRRDLSIAWIDYQKAFDRIPHGWIKKMLRIIKAPRMIRRTIQTLIPMWESVVQIPTEESTIHVPIVFRRGTFQGDSLSPLLFCLCVAPISRMLQLTGGFKSSYHHKPITHIMFMDDLKVFQDNPESLRSAVQDVRDLSEALGMRLGLKKCATAHMKGGKVADGGDIPLPMGEKVVEVAYGETYKYLGVSQLFGVNLRITRQRIKMEYFKRLRQTWSSDISAGNKAIMTNQWVASVLQYYYGVVRWSRTEIRKIDQKTRKIVRQNGAHHANASLERLYLKRKEGGRGLPCLEHQWEREVLTSVAYLLTSKDEQVKGAMRLQQEMEYMGLYSPLAVAKEIAELHGMQVYLACGRVELGGETISAKKMGYELGARQRQTLVERLEGKPLHGVFYRQTLKVEMDVKSTHKWLGSGKLRAETEALIIATQDGVIHTNNYRMKILKESISPLCRACGEREETIGHILSTCRAYKWSLYKDRHDRVLYQLVKTVTDALDMEIPPQLKPPGGRIRRGVIHSTKAHIRVDQSIPTIRKIPHNCPDLTVIEKKRKRINIFEVACAWEPRVLEREKEKEAKYQELAADMAIQWLGFRVRVIPVVIGDMGLVAGLKQHLKRSEMLNEREINHMVEEAQREVLCGSVRIIKRHMSAF